MLKQMRYFSAVVRLGSFSVAAEECFISQSAISQQIQALEKELGVTLLLREKRKFTLTAAGEYFYKKSLVLLHDFDRVTEETKRIGSGKAQKLTVGYLRQYHGRELQQAIPAFRQKYPGISLHMVSGTHEELYELLRSGKADIVVSDLRRKPSEHYVNFFLAKVFLYAEVPTGIPLAELNELSPADLKHLPCILVAPANQLETEEKYHRDYFGIESEFVAADSLEQAKMQVLSGRGFFLAEYREPPAAKIGAVVCIPIKNEKGELCRDYYAFWKKEREESYIEDFAALLERQFLE